MRKLAFFVFSVVFILGPMPAVDAGIDILRFERLVVFGDSLSDNGNAFSLDPSYFKPPTPPYFNGRFSNGPNWVDYFPSVAPSVAHFAPVTAFYAAQQPNDHATNFAIGGSTSGDVNVLSTTLQSFPAQIGTYVASLGGKSAANDLCVIWIGANDFAAGLAAGTLNPSVTVENIRKGIAQLSSAGARTIIVIKVPDIALTPEVMAIPTIVQAARQFVFTVNALLEVEILPFAWLHRITVEIVDINRIFIPLVLNSGRFGFTNSSGFALDPSTGGGDTNPDDYVFWDGFHPTTKAHHIAAEFIYKSIVSSRVFPEILPLARGRIEEVSP
jgi:outer membrane lipase/esterase